MTDSDSKDKAVELLHGLQEEDPLGDVRGLQEAVNSPNRSEWRARTTKLGMGCITVLQNASSVCC